MRLFENGGVEEGKLAEEDGRKEKTGENCNTKCFIIVSRPRGSARFETLFLP
jgi:hypothetical protein